MTTETEEQVLQHYRLMYDSAFILMYMSCSVCIIYTASDPSSYMLNMILLNIVLLIAVITFFTTLTTGVVLNIAFVVGCSAYMIYDVISYGHLSTMQSSFWILMAPLLTGVIWLLTNANRKLKEEERRLMRMRRNMRNDGLLL